MSTTLFLIPDSWDLAVDAYGNIAVADEPYAIAQDVASACRLWKGEARYDTVRGVPYERAVLGYLPPASLLAQWLQTESMTVPEVESADVAVDLNVATRELTGSIMITTSNGEEYALTL